MNTAQATALLLGAHETIDRIDGNLVEQHTTNRQ